MKTNEKLIYEKSSWYKIFDDSGKLNKKELTLLTARMAIDEFADPMRSQSEYPFENGEENNKPLKKIIFKTLRTEITNPHKGVHHCGGEITYKGFSTDIFRVSKIKLDPHRGQYPIFRTFEDEVVFSPDGVVFSPLGEDDLDFEYYTKFEKNNSKVIFETSFREQFSSIKMEKCIHFTGIYFSNNVIINIPEEEFLYPNYWMAQEEIIKLFYIYCKGLEIKALDKMDVKTFFIAVHSEEFSYQQLPSYAYYDSIVKGLFEFLDTMTQKILFLFPPTPEGNSWDRFVEDVFKFKCFFMPPKLYYPDFYLMESQEVALDILKAPQKIPFWENQVKFSPPRILINEDGSINQKQVCDTIESFEYFEKYMLSYPPKDILYCKFEPFIVLSELTCRKVFDSTLNFIRYISTPWLEMLKVEWIKDLGSEYDILIKKAEDFFFFEADFFEKTKAFKRKLQVLRECFSVDCRVIWPRQIEHLTENLKSSFKNALSKFIIDDDLEKNFNDLIKGFDREFVSKIESTIPSFNKGSWNYSFYRTKFRKNIKVLVEQKIKTSYFKGVLVRKPRQPISVWFHTLLPHPFGKDLNTEPFGEGDSFFVEEKKERNNIKSELMRYVVQKPRPTWTYSSRYKTMLGQMNEEDFVFKENPKKAVNRQPEN